MGIVTAIPERSERMIKTARCHYNNLENNLNLIGEEFIISVLPCYAGSGEVYFTIIYKLSTNKEIELDER